MDIVLAKQQLSSLCPSLLPHMVQTNLARRHGLRYQSLQRQFLLLKIIGAGILNLKLRHCVAERRLNLLLCASLQFEGHGWVRGDFLDARDVRFELLPGFEFLAEGVVAVFELCGVCSYVVSIEHLGVKIQWDFGFMAYR